VLVFRQYLNGPDDPSAIPGTAVLAAYIGNAVRETPAAPERRSISRLEQANLRFVGIFYLDFSDTGSDDSTGHRQIRCGDIFLSVE
jgi:hypothetical protein